MDQETLHGHVSDYRMYESIASGGFGSVSIGRDMTTNVPVAVKRLHAHLKDEPGFVERFEQEAATLRGLVHPNIVRLLDQGRELRGGPFIVMEWVEGLTIGDWLKRRGSYPAGEVADVDCQVLEGLEAARAQAP
ncbi:MAG: protein kinase [Chloroflexi bacterium]|nr:protein kinase [Chloroflexota bacterium]